MNKDEVIINNSDITALIAVKGNSERVPKKNIRPFAKSSLLEIKLQQLQSTSIFKEIVVSSEDKDVLARCEPFDVRVHERDPFYSTPTVPMSDVYVYLADQINTEYVAWIPVTNPLVDDKIYSRAANEFNLMNHENYDSLLSVSEVHDYLLFNGKPLNFRSNQWPRSQDLSDVYSINFAINIISKKDMIKNRSTLGDRPKLFVLPEDISIDIDYIDEFNYAETIYMRQQEKNQ